MKGSAQTAVSQEPQAQRPEPAPEQEHAPKEVTPQPETSSPLQQNPSRRQTENQRESPRLHVGITPGDATPLHYAALARLFSDSSIFESLLPFVYGSPVLFTQAIEKFEGNDLNLQVQAHIQDIKGKRVQLINPQAGSEETEDNAYMALQMGIQHLGQGHLRALVSLPLNEENVRRLHADFKNQAVAVAEVFSGNPFRMLLARTMRLSFLTTASRPDMASYLTSQRIEQRLRALYEVLQSDFSITTPRIAVLSADTQNHSQYTEIDKKVTTPLINNLFENGMPVFGPYPAKDFFNKPGAQAFDAVLCMYKEQMEQVFERYPKEDCCYYTASLPIVHVEPVFGGNVESAFRSVFRALCMAADIDAARQQNRKLTEDPLGYHAVSYKRDAHEDN